MNGFHCWGIGNSFEMFFTLSSGKLFALFDGCLRLFDPLTGAWALEALTHPIQKVDEEKKEIQNDTEGSSDEDSQHAGTTSPWTDCAGMITWNSCTYIAICDRQKFAHCFVKRIQTWEKIFSLKLEKTPTCVEFCIDEASSSLSFYAADKFGDVYQFENILSSRNHALPSPILGHLSILTSMTILPEFILTADRDGKIRISHRKRPYLIDQFCLEHRVYIAAFDLASTGGSSNYLEICSVDGDGNIRLWGWNVTSFDGLAEDSQEFIDRRGVSRVSILARHKLIDPSLSSDDIAIRIIGMKRFADSIWLIAEDSLNFYRLDIVRNSQSDDDSASFEFKHISQSPLKAQPVELFKFENEIYAVLIDGNIASLSGSNTLPPFSSPISEKRLSHLSRDFY